MSVRPTKRFIIGLTTLMGLGSLDELPVRAEYSCEPTDILVVDRKAFARTVTTVMDVLEEAGLPSRSELYEEGTDVGEFARKVIDRHPKILIAHYSMFGKATGLQPKKFGLLIRTLETDPESKVHYIVYSYAFRGGVSDSKSRLQRSGGPSELVGPERFDLITVPNGGRFTPGNGDRELVDFARAFVKHGACVR